jgi:hypothetical protein
MGLAGRSCGPGLTSAVRLRQWPRDAGKGQRDVQPDRQERQPGVHPKTPRSPPARYKALASVRDRYEGSLAQSFLARLTALDFADQAMLFGAGLLVSLLPFVILLSAFASQRVDDDISLRLGLDRRAAGIMDHLFTS